MLVLGAAILFPSALRPRTGPSSTPASEPDWLGNPPYAVWQRSKPGVRLASFADAGADGEVVLNATSGSASLAALDAVGVGSLAGKVLVDVARPLDMSEGMRRCCRWRTPDSLGEQIQRALPDARVVKTLTPVLADMSARSSNLFESAKQEVGRCGHTSPLRRRARYPPSLTREGEQIMDQRPLGQTGVSVSTL